MRKVIFLSLITTAVLLSANEITTLETIDVLKKANTKIVKDVSHEQIKVWT